MEGISREKSSRNGVLDPTHPYHSTPSLPGRSAKYTPGGVTVLILANAPLVGGPDQVQALRRSPKAVKLSFHIGCTVSSGVWRTHPLGGPRARSVRYSCHSSYGCISLPWYHPRRYSAGSRSHPAVTTFSSPSPTKNVVFHPRTVTRDHAPTEMVLIVGELDRRAA